MTTNGDSAVRRVLDDSLVDVNSIGGEVEIEVDVSDGEDGGSTEGEEDDDLYGDLETAVFSSASAAKGVPREVLEERLSSASAEISKLKGRISQLCRENVNLQNNFSSLLKTAKEDKNKNIFTLKQLRDQLKYVTTMNERGQSLGKEEVERIRKYCGQVECMLVDQISMDLINQALKSSKYRHLKLAQGVKWTRQFKFENMSVYLGKEQVSFSRLEPVSFPPKTDSQVSHAVPDLPQTNLEVSTQELVRSESLLAPRVVKRPTQASEQKQDNNPRVEKRRQNEKVEISSEVDDSKRRKTESTPVTKSRDQPSNLHVKTSVPESRAVHDNSRDRRPIRDSYIRGENGKDRDRDSRRRSSRAISPTNHDRRNSNYHRSRLKSPEPVRSRSKSPHRTRASRRGLH